MQDIEIDHKEIVLKHCEDYKHSGRLNGFSVRKTPRGYRLRLEDGDFNCFTEINIRTESRLYWESIARMLGIDKPQWMHDSIAEGVNRSIRRQRAAGRKFMSDEEIAALVDEVLAE
jgi:hypothetical protein